MSFSFGNPAGGEKKTGTLFGSTTAPAGGLFGQSQQQQPQQSNATPSGGLFGSSTAPQNNNSNSLFGSTQPQQQQQNSGSSLFGQPQQQQQQQNAGSSLFGQPQQQQQNAGSSLFGQQQQQQQQQQQGQQQQPNMSNSLFGASLQPAPPLNNVQAQSIQQKREGLPQLRQSSAQPFAGSTMNGHSKDSTYSLLKPR
jgi:nuclear pore complex protein Nup54